MIDDRILIGLGIFFFIYILYRLFRPGGFDKEFEREINEILNKEEYKVKGRNE